MTATIDIDPATAVRHSATIDAAALVTLAKATLPHTEGTEDTPSLHRVRLHVDPDQGEATATATSRYTAVIAKTPEGAGIDETDGYPADVFAVDLFPTDLATLAKMFKPGKDERLTLRLDVHGDQRVSVTDVSGLFDGRAYTVPTVGHAEDFPDVAQLVTGVMKAERGIVGTVTYTGDLLRRFAATAAAYGDVLHVEPTAENKPFVVTIGADLIGLLMPRRNEPEVTESQAKTRSDWFTRLA